MNASRAWLTYTEWKDVYGDIVYCKMFGTDVVVLNTVEVAEDLLEKRSANYSDRPQMGIVEPYGMTYNGAMYNHNDLWRAHRRVTHQGLRPNGVVAFLPMQLRRSSELVHNLATSPDAYWRHFQRFSAAVILSSMYGHELGTGEDPILNIIEEGMELVVAIGSPDNALLVDTLPFLKYIPTWLPGGFYNAKSCAKKLAEMTTIPFEGLKKRIATGPCGHSLAEDALARFQDTGKIENFEQVIRDCCGTAYAAGQETTASTLIIFLLAMVLNPDVQARARAEIDAVVGTERIPTFEDRGTLPYVEAVYQETLRWRPVVPLCIPHCTTKEDIYNGYYIPKQAIIIPNIWAMSQNPDKFPSPSEFRPERFLDANGKLTGDTSDFVFGFGRRLCVGRHFASASVWAAMARMLSLFEMKKPKNEHGDEFAPNPEWTTGLTSIPKPFPCSIVLRRPYNGEYDIFADSA
ncbi:cytochrome P450 [Coniophora puteana RWD-64-598 SS2]|uniref:Cytochrome P450 n=1 Tax=Coniophora puteana (strain RWD-64-598) TaxID=741705 RepID=A0A5M3MZT6_CONPW|nr:cytochrome P450 [Coniophora puteana RWD-64-598 SS2]EIW84507.1 cytochrome P450 [Coniophora puteana RWD-64-598 SS2]